MSQPGFHFDPEVQVLNELLWSRNEQAVDFVLETLGADDFHNPLHGQLFAAIDASRQQGHSRDAVSVNKHLLANHERLGIANPNVVSRLLINVAVLDTPQHNLRDNAYTVLEASYRRGFQAAAESLSFAASEAPTHRLFDLLVDHGKQQRSATERLARFHAAYNAAVGTATPQQATAEAPENLSPAQRIQQQLRTQPHQETKLEENAGQATTHVGQDLAM